MLVTRGEIHSVLFGLSSGPRTHHYSLCIHILIFDVAGRACPGCIAGRPPGLRVRWYDDPDLGPGQQGLWPDAGGAYRGKRGSVVYMLLLLSLLSYLNVYCWHGHYTLITLSCVIMTQTIASLAAVPDGRIVCGSRASIRVWDSVADTRESGEASCYISWEPLSFLRLSPPFAAMQCLVKRVFTQILSV